MPETKKTVKKTATKRAAPKKTATKKAAPKKTVTKKAAPKKAVEKKAVVHRVPKPVSFKPIMKKWSDEQWGYACGTIVPACIRKGSYGEQSPRKLEGLMKKVRRGVALPKRISTKHREERAPSAFAKFIHENKDAIKDKSEKPKYANKPGKFMKAAADMFKKKK